eukprot:gene13514-15556_t
MDPIFDPFQAIALVAVTMAALHRALPGFCPVQFVNERPPMKRCLLVILVLSWLQGCSSFKLGYPQLPTLGYWWLDSALSFTDEQSLRAKEALQNTHRWHRYQELPTYLDLLERTTALSQSPVQASQVCSVWVEVQNKMDRTLRTSITQAAPVVMALGPRQWSHLARHWEVKNEDWEKEWLQGTPDERLERRLEKSLDRYSGFYGELSPQQITLIKAQVAQSAWNPHWGRQDRLRRQDDLLSALRQARQSGSVAQVEASLYAVWQRWLTPPDEAGRMMVQKMTQQACDNLAQAAPARQPQIARLRARPA